MPALIPVTFPVCKQIFLNRCVWWPFDSLEVLQSVALYFKRKKALEFQSWLDFVSSYRGPVSMQPCLFLIIDIYLRSRQRGPMILARLEYFSCQCTLRVERGPFSSSRFHENRSMASNFSGPKRNTWFGDSLWCRCPFNSSTFQTNEQSALRN